MRRAPDHYGHTPTRPADQQTSGLGLFEQQPIEEAVTTVTRTITVQQTVRGDKAVAAQRDQEERNLDVRYRAWLAGHLSVFMRLLASAQALKEGGATRIGVKRLVEDYRYAHGVSINNSFVSRIARDLVTQDQSLAPLIELRTLLSKQEAA